MSSLAGALDEIPSHSHTSAPMSDVDMEQFSENASVKDEDDPQEEDEEMADLFGNDEDVEEMKPGRAPSSPSGSAPESDRLPSPERERRQALEYEEEEIAPELAVEVKEANVTFPNIPVPRSSDGNIWVIRMLNFMKVDSKPFHPDTYMGPEHEDEDGQQAESLRQKSMTIKLKVENTVRWRWIKNAAGQDVRQSNSRIIRWSDGSLSLRLGKEIFDVTQHVDNSAGVPRQFIGSGISQSQTQSPAQASSSQSQTPGKSQGLTYLVAQHKRSQVLQSEAVITGSMSLRPTGMQSETHRMLVRAVGQKHNKVARLRMAPDPTMDPEREKMELMKQSQKKSKRKTEREDDFGGGRKKRYSRRTAEHDVWSDDDEEAAAVFGASEDEDEDGAGSRKAKRNVDDRKGPEDYQEDDFVVADSDEEEGGGKKRGREASDMEEDPLDRLDAKIERQDAKKRRRESGGKSNENEETDEDRNGMDVESEEEDEEFKVRRAGARKRAINFNDEEEE